MITLEQLHGYLKADKGNTFNVQHQIGPEIVLYIVFIWRRYDASFDNIQYVGFDEQAIVDYLNDISESIDLLDCSIRLKDGGLWNPDRVAIRKMIIAVY